MFHPDLNNINNKEFNAFDINRVMIFISFIVIAFILLVLLLSYEIIMFITPFVKMLARETISLTTSLTLRHQWLEIVFITTSFAVSMSLLLFTHKILMEMDNYLKNLKKNINAQTQHIAELEEQLSTLERLRSKNVE